MCLSVCNFTQLFSKAKKRCSRRALTRDPTVLWPLLSREPERISAQTLYCQKVHSLPKICAADTICVSLLLLTQLFFESHTSRASQTCSKRKQNLMWNSHSWSFKVMYVGITEKLTTDCISLCNNAGLISKVSEKQPAKTLKIAVVDNPTVVWRPLPREPLRIST